MIKKSYRKECLSSLHPIYLTSMVDIRPKYVYNIRQKWNCLGPAVNVYNINGLIHALVNVKIHIITTIILTNY